MTDQDCPCPAPAMVETLRTEAVDRAVREFDDAEELGAAERAAVASLADRLAARLLVFSAAACPKHAPSLVSR